MIRKRKNAFAGIVKSTKIMCGIVVTLFVTAYSCDKYSPSALENNPLTDDTLINYPSDISFTEYSLEGTSCQWKNINYDDKIIVINSQEKLENHLNCIGGSYPEIDFSTHTLLLVSGTTASGIDSISKKLQQVSASEYKLDLEITLNFADVMQDWILALIVNKIDENINPEFNTAIIYNEIEYSVWKCTDYEYAGEIIELTFYPSIQKLYVKNTPEQLRSEHLIPIYTGLLDYRIENNKLYMKHPDVEEFYVNHFFIIDNVSENEMKLKFGGGILGVRYAIYIFICQTNFNKIQ